MSARTCQAQSAARPRRERRGCSIAERLDVRGRCHLLDDVTSASAKASGSA